MAIAFLLANLAVVLVAAGLRCTPAELRYAAPVALSPAAWWSAAGAVAGLATVLAVARRRALRRPDARRALAELLVFPAALAFEWTLLPAETRDRTALHWAIIAALAGAAAWILWRDRRNAGRWGITGRHFLPALRWLALPTGLMVAAPIVAGVLLGIQGRLSGGAVIYAGYPLYAFVQLMVFQVLLVQRLRRLTSSTAEIVVVAAAMFALAHWPNALLMGACAVGAAVWTIVYLRRPNVYALALSMGLAAAAFATAMPETVTQNLRTGPLYVQRLASSAGGGR